MRMIPDVKVLIFYSPIQVLTYCSTVYVNESLIFALRKRSGSKGLNRGPNALGKNNMF